jgi:hypothetical protein
MNSHLNLVGCILTERSMGRRPYLPQTQLVLRSAPHNARQDSFCQQEQRTSYCHGSAMKARAQVQAKTPKLRHESADLLTSTNIL